MKDRWKHGSLPFKMLSHLSRYDFQFLSYRRIKKRIIFNHLLSVLYLDLSLAKLSLIYLRNSTLKLGKLYIAVTSKIIIFTQRVRDGWKRGTMLFKTHFYPSRYGFWLPRYRRVRERIILDRSPSIFFRFLWLFHSFH